MNILTIKGQDRILFGVVKNTREIIYLSKPTWDCDWYWSFGYLGNRNCHYHLKGYQNGRNMNMFDCLSLDYELTDKIKEKLWSFCEQAATIYQFKEFYEVVYRGGSHFTKHPLKEIVMDKALAEKIAKETLPKLLQKFWDDFGGNQ
jgi:hypothetical protein